MSNLDKLYTSFQSADPMAIGKGENNLLLYALINAPDEGIHLDSKELDSLIFKSNLLHQNENGFNALLAAMWYRVDNHLDLSKEGFNYLLFNSNLKQILEPGSSSTLMLALYLAHTEGSTLLSGHWDYLMSHSNLSYQSKDKKNAFIEALLAKKSGFDLTIFQYEKLERATIWTPGYLKCLSIYGLNELYLELKPKILETRAVLEEQKFLKESLSSLNVATANTQDIKSKSSAMRKLKVNKI